MARYFVLASDGQKYGPADVLTLNAWIGEGRLTEAMIVEEEGTGVRMPATAIPGIAFRPMGGSVPPPGPGPYGGAFSQAPGPQHGYLIGDGGQSDITKAWIFGALALICCPIIFGILDIQAAGRAKTKGHPQAQAAQTFCIVMMILGFVIGFGFRAMTR